MGRSFRWVLSGREIYVLGHHSDLAGFVSTAKVLLGEPHVVLCTADQHLGRQTCRFGERQPVPVTLGSESGIPAGWVGLQGVIPRIAISSAAESDILNVLRPDADCQIVLEGGIRIARSSWLLGHPPKIRLLRRTRIG